jgi:hypothetical protein
MLFLLVVFFFLLAFVGLGVGLLLKRKGLRGGCGHICDSEHHCTCKNEFKAESSENKIDSVRGVIEQDPDSVSQQTGRRSSAQETLRTK